MANEEKKQEVKVVKDIGQVAINNMLGQVVSYAQLEATTLTQKEKSYAVGIITSINKTLMEKNYDWKAINVMGCQLPAQIKRYSRLGLQMENQEFFIDIRNNKNSPLYDINLKYQYQALEKLMIKYCSKKIIRFAKDVICNGDKLKQKTDLSTGLIKLGDHEYFETEDVDYRNKLSNITGAYAIAYVEERGELVPYVAMIDLNRINRARNQATTKVVWDKDTRKMVIKTAVWELWNIMKPFIVMPQDLVKDFDEVAKEELDFTNKEFKSDNIIDVSERIDEKVASENLDNPFDKKVESKEQNIEEKDNLKDAFDEAIDDNDNKEMGYEE